MTASRRKLTLEAALAGYILKRVQDGEVAVTTSIVKDEVLIWLSRYRASALNSFFRAIRLMTTLKIINPTFADEQFAIDNFGKYELGLSDLINVSVMKRLGISEIYTTDRGYKSAGVKVIFDELKNEPDFSDFIDDLIKKGFKLTFEEYYLD